MAGEVAQGEFGGRARRMARLLVGASCAGLFCPASYLRSLLGAGALLAPVAATAAGPRPCLNR